MAKTISSGGVGPINLTPSDHPLSITSAGVVTATGMGAAAIFGNNGVNWSITNSGTVRSATDFGIRLTGNGTVTNTQTGLIAGALGGVGIYGSRAAVVNAGRITGGRAVLLNSGGQVSNTGNVAGVTDGVRVNNGSGHVTNRGTISASNGSGIQLLAGGSITNTSGAVISGLGAYGNGLFISGGRGSVTNAGLLSSSGLGVLISGGGSLNNSGQITAPKGVYFSNVAGTLTNSGNINGSEVAGAYLDAGGTVNNLSGGSIRGGWFGVFIEGPDSNINNAGTIVGGKYDGIVAGLGGTISNAASGYITGGSMAIYVKYRAAGTVTNAGRITSSAGTSVYLADGGVVTNQASGSVTGREWGVFAARAATTVTNSGRLNGGSYGGVGLKAGGTVRNQVGGSIAGGSSGVVIGGGGVIVNEGNISSSTGAAAYLTSGGVVTNTAGAGITGREYGVFASGGAATVTNGGLISGSIDSVVFTASAANSRLVIQPNATFTGAAIAGGANTTIELAAGNGSIAGVGGSAFQGFKTLAVDNGAHWILNGSNTVDTVLNRGTMVVTGIVHATGALDSGSNGLFDLRGGAVLEIAAASGGNTKVNFGSSSKLIIDHWASLGQGASPLLEGFDNTASVDIKDFSASGISVNYNRFSGQLQLTNSSHATATLNFQTSTLSGDEFSSRPTFRATSDGSGGVLVKVV